MRLKGKCYKSVVRLITLYGSECWVAGKKIEQRMSAAKMRIFRGNSEVMRVDRITNAYIKESML